MRKKIILYILITSLLFPISTYIAYFLDSILLSKKLELISIYKIIEILFNNQNIKILTLSIQALFMVLFFIAIFINKFGVFKSKIQKITNNIAIPESYGKGQYGTSRFATNKEFDNTYLKLKLDKNINCMKQRLNYGGIVVKYKNNIKTEEISIVADNKHTLCLGNTGAGKTRRILIESLCTLGLAQESIILSDPKGELYQMTSNFFKNLGYEVNVIDFKNPEKSNKYNFLQPIINAINENNMKKAEDYTWDLVENIVQKSNANTDPLWENGEKSIIAGSIMTVLLENKEHKEYQNLTNVYAFISNMCQTDVNGFMPLSDYIEKLEDDNPAKKIFKISTIAPEKTRSSFFTSALATLRLFSSKSIYTMTNDSDFGLEDIGKKKCVRYIILPDERTTFYTLATLFVSQQYQALVNLADNRGGKLAIRNNFILEEFGNFTKIDNFENMLTVSRSRNIRFSLFLQSFSQLESKYSRSIAQNIMDNTQVWIYLRTSSYNTAETISKKLGIYTVSINSKSNSYNNNSNNTSESVSLATRSLLTPDEILRFESPHCLILQSGCFPAKVELPDLSKWYFNSILGLGDEEQNRLLREKIEKNRKQISDEDIKLWKIWDDYIY